MIIKIILLFILILINGVFSATEIAFLSLNKYELSKEIKKGNKKATKVLSFVNDPNSFLSAIQIAITLSGFLASAFAAESFASEIAEIINISFLEKDVLTSILIVIITIILSYFTLVFGELIPKQIGMAYSKRIAFAMVSILDVVIKFFKPFIVLLSKSVNLFLKLLKIKKENQEDEEQVKQTIFDSQLEDLEKKLLLNVFEFNDTTIKEVMTKKEDIIFIDINDTRENINEKLRQYKYTRFPVVENGKIIGVLNIKDLIVKRQDGFELRNYMRNLLSLDSNMIIDDAFLLLRSKHEVMAEIRENGKCIGIVTIEDIVEEIVGNIYDEYN